MDLFRTMAAGGWLAQLAIASGALLLAAATALLARRWWRRDPALGYSLCVALLVGSLALLPVQWTVKGIGHALLAPWRAWWAERSAPEKAPPRSPLEDGAMLVEAPMGAADAARDVARREADHPRHGRKGRSPDAYLAASIEGREAPDAFGTADPDGPERSEGNGDPTARATPSAASPSSRRAGELVAAGFAKLQQGYAAVPKREALLALWLVGGTWLLLARMRRLFGTLALVRRAQRPDDPDLAVLWRELVAAEPAAARVTLRVSSAVASPACFGWLRPVLLVPADPAPRLSLDALRWALRHELVHVARGDALVATLQAAATTLFWFHPAAWWLSSEVSRLRELSCDRSVVARCGRRRSYAHALLEHAAILNGLNGLNGLTRHHSAIDAEPHSAGVRDALLHWGRSPSQIERRIEMLSMDSNGTPRGRRLGGRLLACSLFALPLLAQVGGAATLLPGDGTPAAAPLAPAVPSAPALPVAQSAPAALPPPVAAPATPAPTAVSRRGEGDTIAPEVPQLPRLPPPAAPRGRARVKRPGTATPSTAPTAGEPARLPPTPSELVPVATPLPPALPATPVMAAPPAGEGGCALCKTQQDEPKARCNAGAACADPAMRDELAKLGYLNEVECVDEVDELDDFEQLESLEELGYLDEEFADLAVDLQDEFADFETEFADLAAEMAQLEQEQSAQADDVARQMDQARAEIERALARANEQVARDMANADEQLAAAMKAIDAAEGLDDADRAKIKATIEKHMVEARSVAKRAIDQSREKSERLLVEQALAQRRAQGFTNDDHKTRQLELALARMAQAQDEEAKVAHARKRSAEGADEAVVARKRKVAAQQDLETRVAEKRAMARKIDEARSTQARRADEQAAEAGAAAELEKFGARKSRSRRVETGNGRGDEETLADRQKMIRIQIEKLQQELMRLQEQLADLESASSVREEPATAPAPVKRGRSMR